MQVYFSTREYERSHMKQPRGRGLWMFRFETYDGHTGMLEHNGSYSDAKRAVKVTLRSWYGVTNPAVDVFVQP